MTSPGPGPRRRVLLALAALVALALVGWHWFSLRSRGFTVHQVMAEAVARVDADGDGVISRAEYQRYADDDAQFLRFDADDSGALDVEEFTEMFRCTGPMTRVPQP